MSTFPKNRQLNKYTVKMVGSSSGKINYVSSPTDSALLKLFKNPSLWSLL